MGHYTNIQFLSIGGLERPCTEEELGRISSLLVPEVRHAVGLRNYISENRSGKFI